MTLQKQIKADSVQAMKAKETERLSTLRLLIAELEKEMKTTGATELSDEQTQTVISRQIKKLDKEIESYLAVGRGTASQEAEKALLQSYLPKQLTDEEIAGHVREVVGNVKTNGQNMGVAMKILSSSLKGKADMNKVSKMVKEQF